MSRTMGAATWRLDGGEDEADGVGAERRGEECVLLVGDPADLDEHDATLLPGPEVRKPQGRTP